jgi:diguanylate cyclase (GGDEF)-like protein/PAS domain S-box-containing protein
MHRIIFFTRKLLFLALALAVLSACFLPAVIFAAGYGFHASALDTKARIKSDVIGQFITTEPDIWMYQDLRLAALVNRSPGPVEEDHVLLLSLDGARVSSAGPPPDWPVMRREAIVFDAGRPAGRIVLTRSLRPLVMETAYMSVFGLAVGAFVFILLWITPVRTLRRAACDLREEKDRLAVTLRSIADAVVTTDPEGRILSINPAGERLLGWSGAEVGGTPVGRVIVLEDAASQTPVDIMTLLAAGAGGDGEARLVTRLGKRICVQVSAAAIRSDANAVWGHVLVLHDIDEIRELSRKLEWQASHDPLTNLANRREFEVSLSAALKGARDRGEHHVLLLMDLDQFKVINDTCGHAAGDRLLCQITDVLRATVRRADCLARVGGDEFALLLTHCPPAKAEEIAASLLRAVDEERFTWEDKVFSVGMSIGLAELTPILADEAAVMRAADNACYAAKLNGKGRVQVYSPDDGALKASTNLMICTARITRAFDDGRFVLHFQPYRALSPGHDGREHGEVLLRMIDDENRIVPPGAFIPAAERFDLMVRLDHWVIAETFAQFSRLPAASRQAWSINLSGQSLSRDQFMEHIVAQAQAHGVLPEGICFEITETAAINNLSNARGMITALRKKGFRFALDDFGSGLSSFAYLKQLPIDYLKIDGCFVRGMVEAPLDRAMVSAAHQIAGILGIRTVAEFVENDAILRELRAIGIDYAQGYAIARPGPLIAHVNGLIASQAPASCATASCAPASCAPASYGGP